MSIIEWDDELYSVGIVQMDEEHKVLIGLINSLYSKRNSPDTEFIESILDTLVHYTKNHFRHEERVMERIGYQAHDHHKQTHRDFEVTLTKAINEFKENGNNKDTLKKLTELLNNWLRHHILVEDKAYGDYLTS